MSQNPTSFILNVVQSKRLKYLRPALRMKPQHCFHSCVIEHLRKHKKRLTFKKPLRDRQAWGKVRLRRDLRELIFPYPDVKHKNIYSSFVVERGCGLQGKRNNGQSQKPHYLETYAWVKKLLRKLNNCQYITFQIKHSKSGSHSITHKFFPTMIMTSFSLQHSIHLMSKCQVQYLGISWDKGLIYKKKSYHTILHNTILAHWIISSLLMLRKSDTYMYSVSAVLQNPCCLILIAKCLNGFVKSFPLEYIHCW